MQKYGGETKFQPCDFPPKGVKSNRRRGEREREKEEKERKLVITMVNSFRLIRCILSIQCVLLELIFFFLSLLGLHYLPEAVKGGKIYI